VGGLGGGGSRALRKPRKAPVCVSSFDADARMAGRLLERRVGSLSAPPGASSGVPAGCLRERIAPVRTSNKTVHAAMATGEPK
jgi:hypothetical protein